MLILVLYVFRRGNRIQLKNVPADMPKENVEHMLSQCGTLLRCELGMHLKL
jgi:hypothetical protein